MPAIPGSPARQRVLAALLRPLTTVAMRSATDVSQQMQRYAMTGTAVKLLVGLK